MRRKTLAPVRSVGRTVVRGGPGPGPLMTPPSFFPCCSFPWNRAREPVSDITGVKPQCGGIYHAKGKGCGKSLRVSTSGGGGQGGMRDRGSESRWCRGGARAASGWWLGPNGKNSRSNLVGPEVGVCGREGYPSEPQTLTNWFGQLDAGSHGRGGEGKREGLPRGGLGQ